MIETSSRLQEPQHLWSGRLQRLPALIVAFLSSVLLPQPGRALPQFPPVVASTYSIPKDGHIAKASCSLCHSGVPSATTLNPYGKDVQEALDKIHSRALTPAILHTLDKLDSDADGFTNGVELAADTLPGDPTSKPTGKTPASTPPVIGATTQPGALAATNEPTENPIKALLFPRHAQHPVLVHFPIALFIMSLLFDFLGWRCKSETLALAGYYNLIASAVTALLSIGTGVLAWLFVFGGPSQSPLFGNNANSDLRNHLLLSTVTTLLILVMWRIRVRDQGRMASQLSRVYVFLGVIAFITITLAGHLGGTLSGVNTP